MADTRPQCTAVRADGQPCQFRSTVDPVSGLCLSHDPARRDQLASARKRGAERSAEARRERKAGKQLDPDEVPPPPETLEDCERMMSWLSHAILTGKIERRTGEAAVKAVRQQQLILGDLKLKQAYRELEAEVKELRKLVRK